MLNVHITLEDAVFPILKVALTVTLSWQDSKFHWKSWVNVVVWLYVSTVGGYLNIMFPLLLLQIVKLTCTLDFDLNCIVSATRLDTQSGSKI